MNRIIKLIGVSALFFTVLGCSDSKPTLHVYNWSDYIAPEVIASFEEKYGCHVVTDTFDSNEAMYAKLKAGCAGFDIVVPTSYQIPLMVREGMLAELNRSNIVNAVGNYPKRLSRFVYDNASFKYSVPYSISSSGFIYIKDKMPKGADVSSWKILEEPSLRGRFSLLNDIRELIGAGLMYCGYSVNSTDRKEIDKAVAKVREWKKNARKFDCESYKTEVAGGSSWLGHGYSSDSLQVILGEEEGMEREDIGFTYPKEGFVISCDEFVILKSSQLKDLAEKFINHIFETENAKANMEYLYTLMPHEEAIGKLDNKLRGYIEPSEEVMKSAQIVESFDTKPEVFEMYNKAYDAIMAGEEQ